MASPIGPERKRPRPGPRPSPELLPALPPTEALCVRRLAAGSGFLRHCLEDIEVEDGLALAAEEEAAGGAAAAEPPEATIELQEVLELVPASAHLSAGARRWLPWVLLWLGGGAAAGDGEWWVAAVGRPAAGAVGTRAACLARERQAVAAVQLLALGRFLLSGRPRDEVLLWVTSADDSASCCRALALALRDGASAEGYGLEDFLDDAAEPARAEAEFDRWCLADGLEALGLELRDHLPLARRLLGDESGSVRAAMARTLSQVSGDLVVEFSTEFLSLLTSARADARATAALALGRADAGSGRVPGLAPRLAALLEDADRGVRDAASKGLSAIGAPAVAAAVQVLHSGTRQAQEAASRALAAIGEPAAAAVAEVLGAECEAPRVWALRALRDMGRGAAAHVDAVAALLEHTMPRLRREALETIAIALHGQAAAKHTERIARCLESPDWSVRAWAARAVASLPEAAVQPHLSAVAGLITDYVPDVVEAAATALGKLCGISGPYANQLAQVFADNDQPSSDAAEAAFRAMLRTGSSGTREAAAAALKGADEEALLRLAPDLAAVAVGDDDRHVREEALQALAALGPQAPACAVQAAEVMLRDGDKVLRRAAVEALHAMGPEAVANHEADLRDLLISAPVGIRRAVLAALETLPAEVYAGPAERPS